MFKPISFYIGLRYTRAKKRSQFVSFIALSSMLGIALGVTVLITVLSVMNGFDFEIRQRIFEMAPQITVQSFSNSISDYQPLEKRLLDFKGVTNAAPYIEGQGMLTSQGLVSPALILGVNPQTIMGKKLRWIFIHLKLYKKSKSYIKNLLFFFHARTNRFDLNPLIP